MIIKPERYINIFSDLGSNILTVHYEACTHLHRTIQEIKNTGMKAGIAINPNTDIEKIIPLFNYLDYILIMSVFPGKGGQKFIPETLIKMEKLVQLIKDRKILIGVDGGVNLNTIKRIYRTGIDVTIVGSAFFGAKNVKKRYVDLLNA